MRPSTRPACNAAAAPPLMGHLVELASRHLTMKQVPTGQVMTAVESGNCLGFAVCSAATSVVRSAKELTITLPPASTSSRAAMMLTVSPTLEV